MAKVICPLLKKECMEHACAWYCHTLGEHPQTKKDIDQWGCAIVFTPLLLVENSNMTRKVQASIDHFRNEMVRSNAETLRLLRGSGSAVEHLLPEKELN